MLIWQSSYIFAPNHCGLLPAGILLMVHHVQDQSLWLRCDASTGSTLWLEAEYLVWFLLVLDTSVFFQSLHAHFDSTFTCVSLVESEVTLSLKLQHLVFYFLCKIPTLEYLQNGKISLFLHRATVFPSLLSGIPHCQIQFPNCGVVVADKVVISARVGTLRRKKQVRQFLGNMAKDDNNDAFTFDATRNKAFEVCFSVVCHYKILMFGFQVVL